MSITATTPTEPRSADSTLTVPANPYIFAKAIQYSQPSRYTLKGEQVILFNKGRYFETTIPNPSIMKELCELTGFKPEYSNMIVQSWKDMEDFVIAMNILGIYVDITIDWI